MRGVNLDMKRQFVGAWMAKLFIVGGYVCSQRWLPVANVGMGRSTYARIINQLESLVVVRRA